MYIGQNEWTHVNCALWSAEVFEDDDGSLKNVHMAVLRGKQLVNHFFASQVNTQFSVCICQTDVYNLLRSVSSAARSVKSQGRQLAAASRLAPVTITSCVLASAIAPSWKTRKCIVQSTGTSSREK